MATTAPATCQISQATSTYSSHHDGAPLPRVTNEARREHSGSCPFDRPVNDANCDFFLLLFKPFSIQGFW